MPANYNECTTLLYLLILYSAYNLCTLFVVLFTKCLLYTSKILLFTCIHSDANAALIALNCSVTYFLLCSKSWK